MEEVSKLNELKKFIMTMNATYLVNELKTYPMKDSHTTLSDIKTKVQTFNYNNATDIVNDLNQWIRSVDC